MKLALVSVASLALLTAASTEAQQVCPSGILATTPTSDFTDHGDGTVTHQRTGLMWKRCVEGLDGTDCSSGTAGSYTWQEALQDADGHSFAGYDDWRLPNIKELSSVVERSCYDPAINLSIFPNDPGSVVWSGTPYALDSQAALAVDFFGGIHRGPARSNNYRVRLVRGGQ